MKNKKTLVILLCVVMVFSVLTGCSKNSNEETTTESSTSNNEDKKMIDGKTLADEQIIKISIDGNPANLDPQTSCDGKALVVLNAYLEGLVRLGADGVPQKDTGLAKDWDISDDGLVYTFHLRDANWSDGSPITAHDFEYAWKRALDPEVASPMASGFFIIKNGYEFNQGKDKQGNDVKVSIDDVGVKALDDKTLEVTLDTQAPFFLNLTAIGYYLPAQQKAIETLGDDYATDADKFVSSGPFVIKEWEQEQYMILEKNENYWDKDNVNIEQIRIDFIEDQGTQVKLYEVDELDTIKIPGEYIDKYKDSEDFKVADTATVNYLLFNCEDEFFSNVKIRKAFSIALEREAIANKVLANSSKPAWGSVPPGMPGKAGGDFSEQSGKQIVDVSVNGQEAIDEANKLLDEGLKEINHTREELQQHTSLVTSDSDEVKKMAAAYQQFWKKNLNIEVPLESMTSKVKWDRFGRGDYTIGQGGGGADYNDPYSLLEIWVTGHGLNDAKYSNSKYDELLSKSMKLSGDERMQVLLDAEKILIEDMPIAPVYFEALNFVEKPKVKNIIRHICGVDYEFKYAYIIEE